MRYRVLLLGTALLVLAACALEQAATHSAPLPATSSPQTSVGALPSPTMTDGATEPTPEATAQTPQEGIVGASFASVLVNRLAVRLEPGTSARQVSCAPEVPVWVDAGDIVHVLPDPPAVDEASTWHRVVAPANHGLPEVGTPCDDVPFVVGWIATGLGEPWVSTDVQCPGLPQSLGALAAASAEPLRVLACFGSLEMRVQGTRLPPPEGGIGFSCPGIEPAWLTCGIDQLTDGSANLSIRIPPGSSLPVDIEMNQTVALDHPAAESCVSLAEGRYSPEAVVAFCRVQLVAVP
jgi:hypothetical protein